MIIGGKFIEQERPGPDSPASREQLRYIETLHCKKFNHGAGFEEWAREQLRERFRARELTRGEASRLIDRLRSMPDWGQGRLFDV
jgi:hypothetical protein